MKELIESMHPRTRPTLENWMRMSLHPTGVRDFTEAAAQDLRLANTLSGKVLRYSGILFDGGKNFLYGLYIGRIVYETLIK